MIVVFIVLTGLSFILAVSFTPLVRTTALRCNLVDRPDNKRKVHKTPIPRVGGVAVAAAYFLSLLLFVVFLSHAERGLGSQFGVVRAIVPGALLIFLVGFADDLFDLKPHHKLGVQILAAVIAAAGGIRIHDIGSLHLNPVVGMVISILWIAVCTNAVNLIDGLDGLAAGTSLLATVVMLSGSLMMGNLGLALATAPLAGALLGFLVFNFNPASIFMGDSGSLLIGFLLASCSIVWSSSAATLLDGVAPLMALAVPVLDTTLAITRRFLSNQPIFKPDRSHIHHRLLARGFSHRATVLLLYAAAATSGALALSLTLVRGHWEITIVAIFGACVVMGVRELGYIEFDALRAVLIRGDLRREITAYVAMRSFEEALTSADTASQCWITIQALCGEFGFHAVRMQLGGDSFGSENAPQRSWAMRIPILTNDWIELCHNPECVQYPNAFLPLASMIRRVLSDKSTFWAQSAAHSSTFKASLYPTMASTAN